MNSARAFAQGFYEVFDLTTNESHGSYVTLDEARGAVRYDRLKAYAIWRHNVRVECCDPYEADDDRVKLALGPVLESLRQALDEPKLTGTHAEIARADDENLDIYEVFS